MKKKVLICVIGLIIILIASYGYSVYKNGKQGGGSTNITGNSEIKADNIENSSGITIYSLKVETKSGEFLQNADGTVTSDESHFKSLPNHGTIEIKIFDDEGKTVKSFKINSGDSLSKTVLLKKSANYTVEFNSMGDFKGSIDFISKTYKIF